MKVSNIYRAARLTFGAATAVSLLVCALPTAMAQNTYHDNNNGNQQHMNDNGNQQHMNDNSRGNQSQNGESRHMQHYHQQQSQFPVYNGREHRKYYNYGGNQFYINLDTGVRIQI